MILRNREILAVGTWPASETLSLDEAGLDDIVASFNALGLAGRIPLKFTHEGPDPRGAPEDGFLPVDANLTKMAMGWVTRIWREGTKLMADMDVPSKVYELIKEGYLKFVSVELLKNVSAYNRVIPYVLDAVALLGAEQPAVGILKDLASSLVARRARVQMRSGSRITLSSVKRESTTSEENAMDENEAKKLRDSVAATVSKLDAIQASNEKLAKDNEELRKQLQTQEENAKKERIEAKRKSIEKLFNDAIEAKRIEPAVREKFLRREPYDKNDKVVEALDVEKDVKAYIDEYAKDADAKIEAERKRQQTRGSDGAAATYDATKPASGQLMAAAKAKAKAEGWDPNKQSDLHRAITATLRDPANKDLATAYKFNHQGGGAA